MYFHACEPCARQFELVPRKLSCECRNPFNALVHLYSLVAVCQCVSSDSNRQEALIIIRKNREEKDVRAIIRRMIRVTFCLSPVDAEYKRRLKDFYSTLEMMKSNVDYLATLPPYLQPDGHLHCAKCGEITSAEKYNLRVNEISDTFVNEYIARIHCCSPQGLKKCKACSSTCIGEGHKYCIECGATQ